MANYSEISLGPFSLLRKSNNGRSAMPAYKFLHRKDLHYWESEGTVKIDTLYSYSRQESIGGVGDPSEIRIKNMHAKIGSVHDPAFSLGVQNLRSLRIADLNSGRDFTLSNFSLHRQNRYVYCLSNTFSLPMYKRWRALEGYDCVIKILDIEDFIDAVESADQAGPNFLGGKSWCGNVEYVEMPVDICKVDMTYYKFLKSESDFLWQDELRISWPRVLPEAETACFIAVPNLTKLIQVMHL